MAIYITRTPEIKSRAIAEIQNLLGEWQITIKKPGRSNAANNYFHKLVDIISQHTGEDAETLKLRIKYSVLPLNEITVGEQKHMYPISTAQLDKKQFSELIEATLLLGAQFDGLVLPLASFYGLGD